MRRGTRVNHYLSYRQHYALSSGLAGFYSLVPRGVVRMNVSTLGMFFNQSISSIADNGQSSQDAYPYLTRIADQNIAKTEQRILPIPSLDDRCCELIGTSLLCSLNSLCSYSYLYSIIVQGIKKILEKYEKVIHSNVTKTTFC